jgi:hypothetical protein
VELCDRKLPSFYMGRLIEVLNPRTLSSRWLLGV